MNITPKSLNRKTTEELETAYDEALAKLPSRAPIYLPTERVGLVDRIMGVTHVDQIYKKDLDAKYRPRLRELREKYKGQKRCFLIGNGPSLNQTDLSVLKDEVTFAVNGFFLKARDLDWAPTFYLVEDHLVAEDRAFWINRFKGSTKLFPAYLGYAFPADDDTIFYNHRPRVSYPDGFDFSMEADKITYTGCTVTFSMMQIAAYLGFEEIYLIGVDASYDIPQDAQEGKDYAVGVLDMKSDDPNHFDPNYFGKGFRWHDPQVEKMVEAYGEARRTLEGTGQMIYNAGVGGMLEVFERRSFQNLFPHARSPEEMEAAHEEMNNKKYPKLLIIDMTAMANGTATGEVKSTLLDGWPQDRFMQIARQGREGFATVVPGDESGTYVETAVSQKEADRAIDAFDPDVVLYRQVPNVSFLHRFAMNTVRRLNKPIVTWLMDDWPAELEKKDPEQWAELRDDLRDLLNQAALNLSICDKMSKAFEERYGKEFKAFANGVNPVHWPAQPHYDSKSLKVRYSGGLAKNMTLDSVLRVARAIEKLAEEGHDVSLEISTQPWWHRDSASEFADFKHTTIETISRDGEGYRAWLAEADAVLIAYNFDEETLRYVRYSMANKMPECLASGSVVVVHGPRDVATVDYLAETKAAIVLTKPDDAHVTSTLKSLLQNPGLRTGLTRKSREVAFDRHNIVELREELRSVIAKAAFPLDAESTSAVGQATVAFQEQPRPTLLRMASQILLDSKKARKIIGSEPETRTALERALADVPDRDPTKIHFQAVYRSAFGEETMDAVFESKNAQT